MNESELAKIPVFDRTATMDRLDNDSALFKELIEIFAADSTRQMAELRSAFAAGEATQMQRSAHALRGALGNIGAMRSHQVALEIERQSKLGECDKDLFNDLEREVRAYMEAVNVQ